MMNTGFVPQGHARIIPIRVIRAWHHEGSGTWLSIQALGPAMGLVWRVSDSWGATPCLSRVVCDTLDEVANYEAACAVAEELLKEGPPPDLLANAQRSALERSKKAQKAANSRWGKQEKTPPRPVPKADAPKPMSTAKPKPKQVTAPKQNAHPDEPDGLTINRTVWRCDKIESPGTIGWEIHHRKLPGTYILLARKKDREEYSVRRHWRENHEDAYDKPLYRVPLANAQLYVETFAAEGPAKWLRDATTYRRGKCPPLA